MKLLKYIFNVFDRYTEDKIRYLGFGYFGKLFFLLIVIPLSIVATCLLVFLALLLWKDINTNGLPENIFLGILKLVSMFVVAVLGVALVISTGGGIIQQVVIAYRVGRSRGKSDELIRVTITMIEGDKESTTIKDEEPKKTCKTFDFLYMIIACLLLLVYVLSLVITFNI